MFVRSAAPDTLQGKAIQAVNEKWGEIMPRNKRGRESIGMAVCKKKYTPFRFYLEKQQEQVVEPTGATTTLTLPTVRVERMFGCPCHHELRKAVIQQYGERVGWEPFGQWSLRKAEDIARRETARLRNGGKTTPTSIDDETLDDWDNSSRDSSAGVDSSGSTASSPVHVSSPVCEFVADNKSRATSLCANGNCLWKIRSAYDDVQEELLEQAAAAAEQEQEVSSSDEKFSNAR